jgi:phosphate transport system protein
MTDRHIDRQYDERLRAIRDEVVRLAARVDALVARAADGAGDPGLAADTRSESLVIDQLERELDRSCMVTLATRAPVASDLGFVMLAMKVATELGRVADLAKHIGERSHESGVTMRDDDAHDVALMAGLVRAMWSDALGAFVHGDGERAGAVLAREGEVDARYAQIFDRTIALMSSDAESVRSGVFVQGVAKRLERMADHACRAADAVLASLDGAGGLEARGLLPRS